MSPSPPPPSPLKKTPPPTLPLDLAPPHPANDAPPTRLTQLFFDHKAALACELMCRLSVREAEAEIHAAFRTVEWAPSSFLLALAQWPLTAPRNVFFKLVHVGIECMKQRAQFHPSPTSPMTSDLAGSLLLEAFDDCRAHACAAFISVFNVSPPHLLAHCMRLIHIHVKFVVTLLDLLGMRHLLPLDLVVFAAIAQNDLDAADTFVMGNTEHQLVYLQILIDRRAQDKAIKKRMTKFNVSERAFPAFYARRMRATLRFLVYNQQFEDIVDTVRDDRELCTYACNFVVSNRGADDPITKLFLVRLGLAETPDFAHIDTTNIELKSFPNKDDLEPLAACLSIADLAGEHSCIFVDTPEALTACVSHLKEASVIGFDCEWKSSTSSSRTSEPCAVLQIASASHAFVIDTIALKTQCTPLRALFFSDSIMKLGFDTKGDVAVLAKVLLSDGEPRPTELFKNLVDVQALAKRLNNAQQPQQNVIAAGREIGEVEEGEIVEDSKVADEPMTQQERTNPVKDATIDGAELSAIEPGNEPPKSATRPGKRKFRKIRKPKKRERGRTEQNENGGGTTLSLAAVAEKYLQKPLDKRSRMSDWERRPLTKAQLQYAALDAMVLVAVFNEMQRRNPAEDFNIALAQLSRPRNSGAGKDDPSPPTDSDDSLPSNFQL